MARITAICDLPVGQVKVLERIEGVSVLLITVSMHQ
ncbi:hypothetical protein LMG33818_001621 [Halomonadaceae bacterium LMG 33818]